MPGSLEATRSKGAAQGAQRLFKSLMEVHHAIYIKRSNSKEDVLEDHDQPCIA
jgi:hypothetical protein